VESERNTRSTAGQRLHLLNSSSIQRKIQQSRMVQFQSQAKKPAREVATNLYLGILSRYPTEDELKVAEAHAAAGKGNPRDAVADLVWALMNNAEFLYRH
jgi:hypothetical protein